MTAGLTVSGLTVRYGAITAVRNISISVGEGETVAIIGPNGAGKTSLVSAVAGIVRPNSGSVVFAGSNLSDLAMEDVVSKGVAIVPEGRRIFASLTVAENLALGATVRRDVGSTQADLDSLFETFPILGRRRRQPAGQLSGGEQQQLAIARALMSQPKLLILDEPSLGLAPAIIDQVYGLLRDIREQGVSILLVEQNGERVFSIASRAYVMNSGEMRLSGTPAEIMNNVGFDAAYFGFGTPSAASQ